MKHRWVSDFFRNIRSQGGFASIAELLVCALLFGAMLIAAAMIGVLAIKSEARTTGAARAQATASRIVRQITRDLRKAQKVAAATPATDRIAITQCVELDSCNTSRTVEYWCDVANSNPQQRTCQTRVNGGGWKLVSQPGELQDVTPAMPFQLVGADGGATAVNPSLITVRLSIVKRGASAEARPPVVIEDSVRLRNWITG